MAVPKEVYSFPTLKQEEIMQILAELQIPTTDELLSKPVCETIRPVYREFVEVLAGVGRQARARSLCPR